MRRSPAATGGAGDHEASLTLACRSRNRIRIGRFSVRVGADHFASGPGAQSTVGRVADSVLDELDRTIGEGEIGSAGMEAAEAPLAQLHAILNPGGIQDRVDPVWRKADVGIEATLPEGASGVSGRIQLGNHERPAGDAVAARVEAVVIPGADEIGKIVARVGRFVLEL